MMHRPLVSVACFCRVATALLGVGAAVLAPGCARAPAADAVTPKIRVQGDPPRPHDMRLDGVRYTDATGWYTAAQLDRFVRDYVRRNGIDFNFRGTECQFWIDRDRDCLARGSYSSGYWRPVLDVKIGWDGYVTEHSLHIAADGNVLAPDIDDGGPP